MENGKRIKQSRLDKIAAIDKKIAVLEARKQRLEAFVKTNDRKLDTRRKIIIGAAVLKLASEDDSFKKMVLNIIDSLSERDQQLFEGYFNN